LENGECGKRTNSQKREKERTGQKGEDHEESFIRTRFLLGCYYNEKKGVEERRASWPEPAKGKQISMEAIRRNPLKGVSKNQIREGRNLRVCIPVALRGGTGVFMMIGL